MQEKRNNTVPFNEMIKGIKGNVANNGASAIGNLILALIIVAIGFALVYGGISLVVAFIALAAGIFLSVPLLIAAGYLLASLSINSLILLLLPTTLPVAVTTLIAFTVTAAAITLIDFLINIPATWYLKQSDTPALKQLISDSITRSTKGIVYIMIPTVLISLACGLPLAVNGIIPNLLTLGVISLGCIAKSLHQSAYIFAIYESKRLECDTDDTTLENQVAATPAIVIGLSLILFIVGLICAALPPVMAIASVAVMAILSLLYGAFLILPALYTLACVAGCNLIMPLLPATLGSFAALSTCLAVTFIITMALDIFVDHCVKQYCMPGAPNDELARFSATNACCTFLLLSLPTAIIAWSCGMPTLLIGSSMLYTLLPISTISLTCLTSAFLSKNSIVIATITHANEMKTTCFQRSDEDYKTVTPSALPMTQMEMTSEFLKDGSL